MYLDKDAKKSYHRSDVYDSDFQPTIELFDIRRLKEHLKN